MPDSLTLDSLRTRLEAEPEFLQGLRQLDLAEERKLTADCEIYRRRVDTRRRAGVDGGFDRSWTAWARDREAEGIGAA